MNLSLIWSKRRTMKNTQRSSRHDAMIQDAKWTEQQQRIKFLAVLFIEVKLLWYSKRLIKERYQLKYIQTCTQKGKKKILIVFPHHTSAEVIDTVPIIHAIGIHCSISAVPLQGSSIVRHRRLCGMRRNVGRGVIGGAAISHASVLHISRIMLRVKS